MAIAYINEKFDPRKHILPSPFKARHTHTHDWNVGSMKRQRYSEQFPACHTGNESQISRPNESCMRFAMTWCGEHKRNELVPQETYDFDLRFWYAESRHPLFVIHSVLSELGFRYYEQVTFLASEPFRRALRKCRSKNDFSNQVAPYRHVFLYAQGRRHRVPFWFVEKYRKETFTAEDFLNERNQERRRLMIRHGVNIGDVLKGLDHRQTDNEGSIYRDTRANRNYLHVKCPSTSEEYLLGVPDGMSPKTARRWTFALPSSAVFAAEA